MVLTPHSDRGFTVVMLLRILALSLVAGLGVLRCAPVDPNEKRDVAEGSVARESGTGRLHEIWKGTPSIVLVNILLRLPPGKREETMVHLHGPDMPHSIPQAMLYGDPFLVLRALTGPDRKAHARRIGATLPQCTQGQLALTALMAHTPAELLDPFVVGNGLYALFLERITRFQRWPIYNKKYLPCFYNLASFALRIGRVGMLRRMARRLSRDLKMLALKHYVNENNAAMIEAMGRRVCYDTPEKGFYAQLPSIENAAVRVTIEQIAHFGYHDEFLRRALEDDRKDIATLILHSEHIDYADLVLYEPRFLEETRPIVLNTDTQWLTPAQTCKHAQALSVIGEHGRAAEMLARCLNHPRGTDLFAAFIAGVDILGPVAFLDSLDIASIGPAKAAFYALAAMEASEGPRQDALGELWGNITRIHKVSATVAINAGVADGEYLLAIIVGVYCSRAWKDHDIRRFAFKFNTEIAIRCAHRYRTIRLKGREKRAQVMPLFDRCLALAESVTDDARDVFLHHGFFSPSRRHRAFKRSALSIRSSNSE